VDDKQANKNKLDNDYSLHMYTSTTRPTHILCGNRTSTGQTDDLSFWRLNSQQLQLVLQDYNHHS